MRITGVHRRADTRPRRASPGGAIAAPARGASPDVHELCSLRQEKRAHTLGLRRGICLAIPALPGAKNPYTYQHKGLVTGATSSYGSVCVKVIIPFLTVCGRGGIAIVKRRNGNHTERITITLTGELKRTLDREAEALGYTRSEAAAEAIREWIRQRAEEDRERVTRLKELERKVDKGTERLAGMVSEAQIHTEMTLAALDHQFEATVGKLGHEELRQRAMAARTRKRER